MNIPTAALTGTPRVKTVPMDVVHYGERFERRIDPWGRAYYWATGEPPPPRSPQETDLSALAEGCVTITPLDYNMTKKVGPGGNAAVAVPLCTDWTGRRTIMPDMALPGPS